MKKFRGILRTMVSLPQKISHIASAYSRVHWLYLFTIVGVLSGIALSLPTWSSIRTYPLVPVIESFVLPSYAHTMLLSVFVVSLLTSIRYQSHRAHLLLLSVLSLGLLCLLDVTRFQPWIFHYISLIGILAIAFYANTSSEKILDAARILIGGMYFWSGVQKLNGTFFAADFPWFTKPLWNIAPDFLLPAFLFFGLLVPFLEIALALGLFYARTRSAAVFGSFCMMALVLLCLGPLGHNWNSAVWPWNIILFLSTITVFWRTDFSTTSFIIRQKQNLLGLSMFCVFWILPLGNVFGLVDHYLSWSLYSGKAPEATLSGDPLILSTLSPNIQDNELSYARWTMKEMNVVPYPEERVFYTVFQAVCSQFNQDPSLVLQVESSQSYFNTEKITTQQSCSHFTE